MGPFPRLGAGSSSNPLQRGVEGCCPGTSDAHAKLVEESEDRDKAELKLLNDLISKWRLPGVSKVPPRKVIPDFSNRGHTGLSVEHVHYLATSFKEKGRWRCVRWGIGSSLRFRRGFGKDAWC